MEESKAYVASQFLAKTSSGENVNAYTLQGAGGVKMEVNNYGGNLHQEQHCYGCVQAGILYSERFLYKAHLA